jgi:short-subunit dehydrogenase
MSSTAGVFSAPNLSVYCSSKFAITGLNMSMIAELDEFYRDANIKVTSVRVDILND